MPGARRRRQPARRGRRRRLSRRRSPPRRQRGVATRALAPCAWPPATGRWRSTPRETSIARGMLAPDARLLLLAEASATRDWKAAAPRSTGSRGPFSPCPGAARLAGLRVEAGRSARDPCRRPAEPLGASLCRGASAADAARAAAGRGGAAELLSATGLGGGGRAPRLRIAGAPLLAGGRPRAARCRCSRASRAARRRPHALIERGKPLPGAIDRRGRHRRVPGAARARSPRPEHHAASRRHFARLATLLAPENSETWLVASDLLGAQDRHGCALAVLANVGPAILSPQRRAMRGSGCSSPAATRERAGRGRGGGEAPAPASATGPARRRLIASSTARRRRRSLRAARSRAAPRARGDAAPAVDACGCCAAARSTRPATGRRRKRGARRGAPARPAAAGGAQLSRLCPARAAREYRGGGEADPRGEPAPARQCGDHRFAGLGAVPARATCRGRSSCSSRRRRRQPADVAINEHLGDAYYTAGRRYEARYAWAAALVYAEGADATRLERQDRDGPDAGARRALMRGERLRQDQPRAACAGARGGRLSSHRNPLRLLRGWRRAERRAGGSAFASRSSVLSPTRSRTSATIWSLRGARRAVGAGPRR